MNNVNGVFVSSLSLKEWMNGFGFGNQVKYDSISRFALYPVCMYNWYLLTALTHKHTQSHTPCTTKTILINIYFSWCRKQAEYLGLRNEKTAKRSYSHSFHRSHMRIFPYLESKGHLNSIFCTAGGEWGLQKNKMMFFLHLSFWFAPTLGNGKNVIIIIRSDSHPPSLLFAFQGHEIIVERCIQIVIKNKSDPGEEREKKLTQMIKRKIEYIWRWKMIRFTARPQNWTRRRRKL